MGRRQAGPSSSSSRPRSSTCRWSRVCQLNRSSEARADKRPLLSDLRESGPLEQDADVVILLHRDDYYDAEARTGEADLIVAKNRSGPAGTVAVTPALHWSTFRNMAGAA